jgi:mannose-1-phosphate guanylyltransferase
MSRCPRLHVVVLGPPHHATIERALEITSPDRVQVVVGAPHATSARRQIATHPGVELVVQPHRFEAVPGVLLPIARIAARTWDAQVVFLPSDHHIASSAPIMRALRDGELRDRIVLLGVEPTSPEPERGWILRGARIGRTLGFEASLIEDRPPRPSAEELLRRGALWNTCIHAGPVDVYWSLARRSLPDQARALERYALAIGGRDEVAALEDAYREMAAASAGRDVLAHADGLAVVPVTGAGWTDLALAS